MRAEYLNSPAFAALRLSPAQVRAAESLPVIFSQFFGKRLELWLREVNKLVLAQPSAPVE